MLPVGGVQAHTDGLDKKVVIAKLGNGTISDQALGLGLGDDDCLHGDSMGDKGERKLE